MTGGGFGALDAMNKTLKNNARLLRKIRVFDRIKGDNSALKNRKFKSSKKATPDQLEQIRAKALADNRRSSTIQIIKIIVGLGIVMVILYLLIGNVLLEHM